MIKNIYFISIFLLSCLSIQVSAQKSCTQKLRDARTAYQEGKLNTLPALLNACIESGFSKEEKVEALRLVTLAYLFQENEQLAEKSYLKLLQTDPEFQPNQLAEPTELILLHEKFDTSPKFYFGGKLGGAYSMVQVVKPTAAIHSELKPGYYSFSSVIGAGLFFERPINLKSSANVELYFMRRALTLNKESVASAEQSFTQTITEIHQWIEMPLLYNYKLIDKPTMLQATGGLAFHYLINAGLSSEGVGDPINNLDKLNRRNKFNMSGLIGLRANFKSSGTPYISISLMYQHRLLNEVKYTSEYTTAEVDAMTNSAYKDGQFKGHALWLKLGVRIPYYNPQLK